LASAGSTRPSSFNRASALMGFSFGICRGEAQFSR
jgi:hypothetical protein